MDRQIARLLQDGEWFCPLLLVVSLALAFWLTRRNRYFRPSGWRQWCISPMLVIVAILAGGGYYFARTANRTMDHRLENLTFKLLSDDSEHSISEYRGRVVLLNFWATWCPPCVMEMPDLEKLYATYRDRGLTVITVSDQDKEALLKFAETHPLRTVSGYYESACPTSGMAGIACAGRPFTMLIDRDGRVVDRIIRYSYEEFEEAVQRLL